MDESAGPRRDADAPRSDESTARTPGRRRFLQAGAVVAGLSLSGCLGDLSNDDGTTDAATLADFRGSGPLVESRPRLEAPRIENLANLEGELTIYLGGGEGGLYTTLLELLTSIYPDFEPKLRPGGTAEQANTIIEEMDGGGSPADVFWSVDAGSLAAVADAGHLQSMPTSAISGVPENFRPNNEWVGVSGRARAIPYNTDEYSAEDIPNKVARLANRGSLASAMGWAPSYGAFISFVTAMRVMEGNSTTKQWLTDMVDHGVDKYGNEFLVSNAVANGEIAAGFANHYYALRVKQQRPEAPLDLAFTNGDAGALINAAGAGLVSGTEKTDLATTFVKHLLSAEAQEFFATRSFAYPMVSGVPPVGDLPPIDELKPPELSLSKLSNVQPTLDLMQETGVL